jgi:hypothetical protein
MVELQPPKNTKPTGKNTKPTRVTENEVTEDVEKGGSDTKEQVCSPSTSTSHQPLYC